MRYLNGVLASKVDRILLMMSSGGKLKREKFLEENIINLYYTHLLYIFNFSVAVWVEGLLLFESKNNFFC